MHVQVTSDRHIHASAAQLEAIRANVESGLGRYGTQVTRVEVHLSDENGDKEIGDDKRCVIEVRLGGLKPYAVTHHAAMVEQAVDGAIDRMIGQLDSALGRIGAKKGRPSFGSVPNG
jgi:hypothetical protein